MRKMTAVVAALLFVPLAAAQAGEPAMAKQDFGIAVHGGAGTLGRNEISTETETAVREALSRALDAGHAILAGGGTSLDAVEMAVRVLEDSPLFNAGRGAVYTHDETHELDASIMNGATLEAGAVAGVTRIANPVRLARRVMEASKHVMLAGPGAEQFARAQGFDLVEPGYFGTERRLEQLRDAREREKTGQTERINPLAADEKFGTVGAVALDTHGNLAAATSTGGMTNKRYGRVGDSPIIGAGTYADNASCAVSATGHGEYFIRHAVAHDVCARMRYLGIPLAEAAAQVVEGKLVDAGGSGGIIAIDRAGRVAMPFNTEGMYRGYRVGDAPAVTAIFRD